MDLIDRYLGSVRRNLPDAGSGDILAELADALRSRQEEREAALGRPLRRDEMSAMLKAFGHPLVVAARYRPHQYLIGPATFPFYWFTLKVVLTTGAALFAGLLALSLIVGSHVGLPALGQSVAGIWWFLLVALGVVTLVFAILERNGFPESHLRQWRPELLPEPTDGPGNAWNNIFEVGIGIAFLLWWIGLAPVPEMSGNRLGIAPAPVWQLCYGPILFFAWIQLFASLVKWLRPRWVRVRWLLTIGASLAGLAIVASLARAGAWVAPMADAADPAGAADLAKSLNLAIGISVAIVGATMAVQLVVSLWKLLRPRRRP